ncbi:MAG: NAD(P)-binding domain-containing protein, partial [Paludibacter sp.]
METTNLQIAIIGAGNMGGAIARGLSKGKLIQSKNIRVSDVSQSNLDAITAFAPEITVSTSNRDIIKDADIIILAVKPWLVEVVAEEIEHKFDFKKQIIVSIAAGVNFEQLAGLFDTEATFFRVIPNTAIDVLKSVSTVASFRA